jgi:hypothetical protein
MSDPGEIKLQSPVRLGLRENLFQFSLLVLVNAFVGGMVGLERTVVPLIGTEEFKIASATVVASFIISFGVTKAMTNLVSRQLADRSPWTEARIGLGLARRAAGSLHDHLGAQLELDRRRQRAAGY